MRWWVRRIGISAGLAAAVPRVAGALASRVPLQAALGASAAGLSVCATAREHGVVDAEAWVPLLAIPMALELYEDTYLGTADSAVRLVEEIGLDNVGLNADVANLIRLHRPVEPWRELFAKTMPYANYLHVKNYTRDEAADQSWSTSVPSTMETGLINYRQVLRDAVADIVPGEVLSKREKIGFEPPHQEWLGEAETMAVAAEILLDPVTAEHGILDLAAVEADVKAGVWRDPPGLWRALNAELWLRTFGPVWAAAA